MPMQGEYVFDDQIRTVKGKYGQIRAGEAKCG